MKSLIPTLKRNSACKTQEDHHKIRLALSVVEKQKESFYMDNSSVKGQNCILFKNHRGTMNSKKKNWDENFFLLFYN